MRIMHLVLRPRFSGAEILARDLCLIQKEEQTVAFASMDCPQEDFLPVLANLKGKGVSVQVPDHEVGRAGRLRQLFRAFGTFKPDVVFAHSQIPMYYASLFQSFFNHSLVKVIHSGAGERYGLADRILTPRNVHVIGVNEKILLAYAVNSKGTVLPHFVPNGIFVEAFRKALPLERPVDRKLVVQVGRVCDTKGQLEALEAIIRLGRPDVDYWVAGIREDEAYLQAVQGKAKELLGEFRWLGGRSDIPELLATSDVVLMPSACEAHPIAYLEALASARPVVANRIGVFQNQGNFGGTHFIYRNEPQGFADAILSALSGPNHWERDLSGFDIAQTAREYDRIAQLAIGSEHE